MKPSQNCIDFIKHWEKYVDHAYQDVAGIWTIGYGTIQYPDGKKVKKDELVDLVRAEAYLKYEVEVKADGVEKMLAPVSLNQNQFDALVSFAYNCGTAALRGSTLLKRVKNNPSDPAIRDAFMMWTKAKVHGVLQPVKGLIMRRKAEADLYFT